FSTDGLHPSDVGQALVANEFIKVINDSFGASIPLVDLAEIVGINFGVSPVKPAQPLDMNELNFGITSDEIQTFFSPLR
ncbi:MAG: hypothetical protein HKN21_06360, partial [Candidatus Eisenbacteria bacterium]|nr:hypothetical protein [Candidatus Eisenbacteria bacterium]